MLFKRLDKIKRSSIMMTIVFMFIGFILLLLPEAYIPFLNDALAVLMLITCAQAVMNFISSSKALIHYLRLSGGLLIGLFGFVFLVYDGFFVTALYWLVGTIPILLGFYGIYHALAFARRSGRRGWWILIAMSGMLLLFGAVNFMNPWAYSIGAQMKVIGGTMAYSALVSALSLIWVWPFRQYEEEDTRLEK